MRYIVFLICFFVLSNCTAEHTPLSETDVIIIEKDSTITIVDTITKPEGGKKYYLALGDSYTVGQSVDSSESFPAQLANRIKEKSNVQLALEIIAATGWTTGNLIKALDYGTERKSYDLVTLLIGVNNQYSQLPFSTYKKEFPILLNRAIDLANGNSKNVIVVSIPDYAYTPYSKGFDTQKISDEIDEYNAFAKKVSTSNNVEFITITDITRQGLIDTELVAGDDLHPSGKAYGKFVERIYPKTVSILE